MACGSLYALIFLVLRILRFRVFVPSALNVMARAAIAHILPHDGLKIFAIAGGKSTYPRAFAAIAGIAQASGWIAASSGDRARHFSSPTFWLPKLMLMADRPVRI